mgnify:CR=1 FL=1
MPGLVHGVEGGPAGPERDQQRQGWQANEIMAGLAAVRHVVGSSLLTRLTLGNLGLWMLATLLVAGVAFVAVMMATRGERLLARLFGAPSAGPLERGLEAALQGTHVSEHGCFAIHRTATAVSSFSWHARTDPARVMGLTMPLERGMRTAATRGFTRPAAATMTARTLYPMDLRWFWRMERRAAALARNPAANG